MKKLTQTTEELYKMYQGGMSTFSIAEKVGVTPGAIQSRFRIAGLKMRNLSKAHELAYQKKRHPRTGAKGKNHWAWKGGREQRGYRKTKKEKCELCQARLNLCIHHKDFDHYNNQPENLQILCLSCHMSLHRKAYWDAKKNGQ